MENEILDYQEVMERVENDRELLIELIEIFLDDCPPKIRKIREAAAGGDYTQMSDMAHSLKGSSGNLAAKKMSSLFLQIEQKGKSQDASGVDDILGDAEALLQELRGYLQKLKDGGQ